MTVFGVRVAVRPVDGVIIVDIVMLPVNPSKGQISIAVLLDPPTKKLRKEKSGNIEKSPTSTVIKNECESAPLVIETFTENMPRTEELTVRVETVEPPEVRVALVGLSVALTVLEVIVERLTVPAKPFALVKVMAIEEDPLTNTSSGVLLAETVKLGMKSVAR
jgi:hypothetical protein